MAVLVPPMCNDPVGEGAKRTRIVEETCLAAFALNKRGTDLKGTQRVAFNMDLSMVSVLW